MVDKSFRALGPVVELLAGTSSNIDVSRLTVSGVAYDSRLVQPGYAFVCVPGQRFDGNLFIDQALKNGAGAIFSERPRRDCPVPYFVVPDARQALSVLCDHFYDYPSRKLRPIGVTGTNGKTTTTHLVEHILNFAGRKTGLVGTLGYRLPGELEYRASQHTTPESADLHNMLSQMVDAGCKYAAIEVSSHALAQSRVLGVHFAVCCLTNVTQDHLDFHQTMEHYWHSKRTLFEELAQSCHGDRSAIVNLDDKLAREFLKAVPAGVRRITYGWDKPADIYVERADFRSGVTGLKVATPGGAFAADINLAGRFNVYNVLASSAIALAEGVSIGIVGEALSTFAGVSGRFEVVSDDCDPLCIVDYAHTPDGLENVLSTARNLVPEGGRLIAVFGCGGDRDVSKRSQMGAIAEARADEVIVTSDNPRSENPQTIIADILAGIKRMKGARVEPDRARAIRLAIQGCSKSDVIVVAGKGHENYQILSDRTIPFDDRREVRQALKERSMSVGEDQLAVTEVD